MLQRSKILSFIIDKISHKIIRDFGEIENMQNNPSLSIKFANACYKRVEEILIDTILENGLKCNIKNINGEFIKKTENAKFSYIICPIDALLNFSRAIPVFSTFISIEDENQQILSSILHNPIYNETYSCEKFSGLFFNNKRFISSKFILTMSKNINIAFIDDRKFANIDKIKDYEVRISGCLSYDIINLVFKKIDLCVISNQNENFIKYLSLFLKEGKKSIDKKKDMIILK